MTEEQKKLIAEVRMSAEIQKTVQNSVAVGAEKPLRGALLMAQEADLTIKALDALEAAGKCKYVPQGTFAKECGKCGTVWNKNLVEGYFKHCPGCGCEIEATE